MPSVEIKATFHGSEVSVKEQANLQLPEGAGQELDLLAKAIKRLAVALNPALVDLSEQSRQILAALAKVGIRPPGGQE